MSIDIGGRREKEWYICNMYILCIYCIICIIFVCVYKVNNLSTTVGVVMTIEEHVVEVVYNV